LPGERNRAQARVKDIIIYAAAIQGDPQGAPLLADISRATHDLGAFGNGSRMKYVANSWSRSTTWRGGSDVLGMKAGRNPQVYPRHGTRPAPAIRACSSCARP